MQSDHILLVHGAWHGSWCWDTLLPYLQQAGLGATTVDLPSVGHGGDLYDDASVVAAALDGLSGSTVVLGHSYGGQVISQATAGRSDVAHLVYLCAFMLDEEESLATALGGDLPPWFDVDTTPGVIRALTPESVFYGDVDPELTAASVARLGTQTLSSFGGPLTAVGWRQHPTTYVGCSEDQALPYPAQEAMSARAQSVVSLATSHSPFLSQPARVAEIVADVAR